MECARQIVSGAVVNCYAARLRELLREFRELLFLTRAGAFFATGRDDFALRERELLDLALDRDPAVTLARLLEPVRNAPLFWVRLRWRPERRELAELRAFLLR